MQPCFGKKKTCFCDFFLGPHRENWPPAVGQTERVVLPGPHGPPDGSTQRPVLPPVQPRAEMLSKGASGQLRRGQDAQGQQHLRQKSPVIPQTSYPTSLLFCFRPLFVHDCVERLLEDVLHSQRLRGGGGEVFLPRWQRATEGTERGGREVTSCLAGQQGQKGLKE